MLQCVTILESMNKLVHSLLEKLYEVYTDDFASSRNSFVGSFELYQKLKYCFMEGRFNMRKWASNSDKLMERIERQECELPSTVKTDAK